MKHVTIDTDQMADLVPVAMARPILTPPRVHAGPSVKETEYSLFVWTDPWTGALIVEAGDFTISPSLTHSRGPCWGCLVPNQKVGDPDPGCPHKNPVVLKAGAELFVGSHLLGQFRLTGDVNDLPDRFWDVIEKQAYAETENPAWRGRWLAQPPLKVSGVEIV